jgi:hypothetical protein
MRTEASELARRLADQAEAVCRHYLPNGRREGRYWLVGDVMNSRGRSLYVRLRASDGGRATAGKWTDAATGERGDLLDLIGATRNLSTLRATLDEARSFLSLPRDEVAEVRTTAPRGSSEAARRLFAISRPITHTVAEAYLRRRGITDLRNCGSLRFHPRCFYLPGEEEPVDTRQAWPALIAKVTDADGGLTGVHRTWLDPSGADKAPVATPRRAMGDLAGQAVRFGVVVDVMAAGEGIETVLSVRSVMPTMPLAATLSAAHLAAFIPPPGLVRLYILQDNDPAGRRASEMLTNRSEALGIEALTLTPGLDDFNDDLRRLGPDPMGAAIRVQLSPKDVPRFWRPASNL